MRGRRRKHTMGCHEKVRIKRRVDIFKVEKIKCYYPSKDYLADQETELNEK